MNNSGNWWEFYFVRYFIGSIVGSLIILGLAFHEASGISHIISTYTSVDALKFKDITMPFLVGMLFLGAAFCYIASAPMLVLHVLRCKLQVTKRNVIGKNLFLILAFFIAISVLCFIFIPSAFPFLIAFYVVALLVALYTALYRSNDEKSLFAFYKKLAEHRSIDSPINKEYVESYRHIREHGNAFLILMFELILGVGLFNCTSLAGVISLTAFWLVPSIPVWLLGVQLEGRLADLSEKEATPSETTTSEVSEPESNEGVAEERNNKAQ